MRNLPVYMAVLLTFIIAPSTVRAASSIPEDHTSAVILAYHRIGEDSDPDSNLRTSQFEAQIEELITGGYTILPLPDIINALKNRTELPERTVALTFEGGYKSAYLNAMPVLLKHKIPFTVFYVTDFTETDSNQYLDTAELKKLKSSDLVHIGLMPAALKRLAGAPETEIKSHINRARQHFRETFKHEATLFSYPFGEYSKPYKDIIAQSGFDAALSHNSGAASSASDLFALPRFTMTDSYGTLARFRMITRALPLPAQDIEPENPYLNITHPQIGFTAPEGLQADLKDMSCFISGQTETEINVISHRIEIRLNNDIEDDRIRVNCTLPGPEDEDKTPRWRWFGMLLIKPEPSISPQLP